MNNIDDVEELKLTFGLFLPFARIYQHNGK